MVKFLWPGLLFLYLLIKLMTFPFVSILSSKDWKVYLRHGQSFQNTEQFGVLILCSIISDHQIIPYLSMGLLGLKLTLLMCLIAGGQRCQTLHAIDIRDIKFVEAKCVIPIYEKLTQTKSGVHMKPMEFKLFTSDPKLCVINDLKVYLDKTESIRKDKRLFISYYYMENYWNKGLWSPDNSS